MIEKELPEEQKALNTRVKKGIIVFSILFLLGLGGILIWNFMTYASLQRHAGYTVGRITDSWKQKGSPYSSYEYLVKDVLFHHVQGGEYTVNDTVLIVYDTTAPHFSILAEYPLTLSVDDQGSILFLDTSKVKFSWWDYLPGQPIFSKAE